jgi:hypothetical protein
MMDKSKTGDCVSYLRHALFSLLDFLALEGGILSQNVGFELPLNAAKYLRTGETSHDDLAMQAMVWLCKIWFRAIWIGVVWFGVS